MTKRFIGGVLLVVVLSLTLIGVVSASSEKPSTPAPQDALTQEKNAMSKEERQAAENSKYLGAAVPLK